MKKQLFLLLTMVLLSGIVAFNFILITAQKFNLKITSADPKVYQEKFVRDRYGILFNAPWLIKKVEQDSLDSRLNKMSNYRYLQYKKFYKEFFRQQNIKYLLFGRGYGGFNVYQNLYLNLLAYLGILGFSMYMYIIIYILWRGIKSGVISDPEAGIAARAMVMGGISGIVGFGVNNLFDNLIYFPPFGLNFWILSGLVLGNSYREKNA